MILLYIVLLPFKLWRYVLKICEIEPTDLLFFVVLLAFKSADKIFRTLFNIICKKDFRNEFFF